jgi:peptide/nickel transport system permease protein
MGANLPNPAAGGDDARRRFGVSGLGMWARFLAQRLLGAVLVVFVLVILVFLMVRLIPGNPAQKHLGFSATPSAVAQLTRDLGLNHPLDVQFWNYIKNLVHGNLGYSTQFSAAGEASSVSVGTIISQRIGSTLQLAVFGLVLVLVTAIPGGILAGVLTREGRHRRLEVLFTGSTSVLGAIPDFLAGTLLLFVFAVTLGLLPVSGTGFNALILPAIAVALAPAAYLARIVRIETLNVLAQDYIATARSKRLPWRIIAFQHVLPNVLAPALTLGGLIFAQLIGGTILVEAVFNRPGLGTALVQAVTATDYPTVQGITLVLGLFVIGVNLVVDILIAVIDPRALRRSS